MDTIILENFWRRNLHGELPGNSTWNEEIAFFYKKGISIEKIVRYLHFEKPALDTFADWVATHTITAGNQDDHAEIVLSDGDLDFWNRNGYIVVKNAIPETDCQAACEAIWDFLQMWPDDQESWYSHHPAKWGMMIDFSNHPTLNKNRESSKIRKAFEQLYQTDQIYKSVDKVSFNAPVYKNHGFLGSGLHWDVSLEQPIPFKLQGLIYLSDCNEKDGCFQCVAGFHHQIERWMEGLAPHDNPREIALKTLKPTSITGKAGDLVIWHQALPHCASPNHGTLPRMVQYLTYLPEESGETRKWI